MFIFPIVVILVIILLAANIRIVPQAHSFIVERLGAYKETWDGDAAHHGCHSDTGQSSPRR